MEKVFDLHIHYTFQIPLRETAEIFKEEFSFTETEKFCFLSLPHHSDGKRVDFDEMQNLKGLFLKQAFSPNAYAFAGLEHPDRHDDTEAVANDFLAQAKRYFSVGYDGIKMLEGYPSLVKAWSLPLDSPIYDKFYRFAEEVGFPVLMHLANPKENWDIHSASPDAIALGRVYDTTYPTKEDLTEQVFRILQKFPKLKLILAHFGFMSYDVEEAERFLSYPNTSFDITPGGEQLLRMQKEWDSWLPFWKKHQERIFYGTDFYAFPKDDTWETAFNRRPKFLRQFLETDGEYIYLDEPFHGVNLDEAMRDKLYRENFLRLLGTPKTIDLVYLRQEAERLLSVKNKRSPYADSDLQYVLQTLDKTQNNG